MGWALSIRALRLRQGLKQAALADILGLDQATVSRWERGQCVPTIAVQQQVRAKIEAFDGETGHLQALFESVVASPYRVLLTAPGTFLIVASSESALEYFELSEGPFCEYNWVNNMRTAHQDKVYTLVAAGYLADKTITHVQSCLALSMPSGGVVLNHSTYYPVWTGETQPRFIVRQEGRCAYDGRPGQLVIHRSTRPPEIIPLPNE